MVASHMLSLCRRTDTKAELVYFDLNGFKAINDSLGHAAGDELLRHFASLLLKCFRSADVVARLGGDEFVVLMAGSDASSDKALLRLERLVAEEGCALRGRLAWSVGRVAFDSGRHGSVERLLEDADKEMYRHKSERCATGS